MSGTNNMQSQHAPTVRVVSTLRPSHAPQQAPPQLMQAQAQRRATTVRRQV